jgi:hypothetical protein
MITDSPDEVCGRQIQQDASQGHGHHWRSVSRQDIPADVVAEIEGEILDGGQEECARFSASNGQYYRW